MLFEEMLERILPAATNLRRELHSNPEIALEERETRKRLKAFLGAGFQYRTPLLETDLIAELPGRVAGPCIALRADMDALPMNEQSGRDWASSNPGRMHACGHDGHMAILASTARLLSENGIVPERTVRFVFQPGEEVVGAGRELAALGAYDGALSAYALHGWPGLPLSSIGVKDGDFFGASHTFRALFRGQGVHGAYPERGNNPLPAAARAVLKLQNLHEQVFRDFGEVVSPCALNGGSAANVIPDEASILGTVRYLDPERGRILEETIREILSESELVYETIYDLPVINDGSRCDVVRRVAAKARDSGGLELIEEEIVERGSEDFAFALERVPGCLFKLGLGEDMPSLHSPGFDFPDEALAAGILMMTRLAMGEEEQ